MSQHKYKVIYFDARGGAEPIRLLFAAAGQPFEDVRLTQEQWALEKPKTPFGQVPVLEIDGKRYAQRVAILNYLAREFGLYGHGNLQGLEIDQIVQLGVDLVSHLVKAYYETDEAKKAEILKNVSETEIPKFIKFFENLLKTNKSGYFVGDGLTSADLFVYDLFFNLEQRKLVNIKQASSLLHAHAQKVEANDKIKAYLAKRKVTEN